MGSLSTRAGELSERLAQNVQAVCRHYLPNGRREGRYWMVGDVAGAPGRSLYVRLHETGRGRIGNWVDAATGEHGDLLDLIHLNQRHASLAEAIAEAERFLALEPVPRPGAHHARKGSAPKGSALSARRLFAAGQPLAGTPAATYLASRGITRLDSLASLRFHPRCYYRPTADDAPDTPCAFPAMLASVTDNDGHQTGTHRTFLSSGGHGAPGYGKADVAAPRRAMGNILGHAVRFGRCDEVMIAGEGIETMLSLREALPLVPGAAATSGAHLAALLFPPGLRRLYVACDRDPAGQAALAVLEERATAAGIGLVALMPVLGDFNDDLLAHGAPALAVRIAGQLHEQDRSRFLVSRG